MVIPNYTYMKLKMLGPNGTITVSTITSAIIASKELLSPHQVVDEEVPDTKKSSESFRLAKDTKEVPIDPSSYDDKVVRIGTTLSPK
jgi:hypothetical protein